MDAENYYETLGIRPEADDEEVKQAYRELAKSYHPDHNPGDAEAERRFKLIGTAYEALKDAPRRQIYDEWIAFNEGQQKSRRRQWNRLAAVLALLLLGPSSVFYGMVVFGGATLFGESEKSQVAAVSEPVGAGKTQSSIKSPDRLTRETSVRTQRQSESTISASNAPQPAGLENRPDEAENVTNTIGSATSSVPAARDNSATDVVLIDERRDALSAERDDKPASESRSDGSIAATPSNDEPSGLASITGTSRSNTEKIASRLPKKAPQTETVGALRDISRNDSASSEIGAIASAQILAELKEPEGAGSSLAEPQTLAGQAQQTAAPTKPRYEADTFSDCQFCPTMSLSRRPKSVLAATNLAVSLSEITVAQWNVCVEDGDCPPYHLEENDPAAPVTGLNADHAAGYAAWLSRRTGEEYRIVTPLPPSSSNPTPAASSAYCDPVGNRRQFSGWDWLDEAPRPDCPPSTASQSLRGKVGGFRVARPVRQQG